MKYTTNNMTVSLTLALAVFLRSHGYDVHWHATGDTDAQTAGLSTAKGTVTLVPEFPANPTYIVRLRDDSAGAEEVVIPALSVQLPNGASRGDILGLGDPRYFWQRDLRVDGLATDEFQHRELADLLHDWLQSVERKEFTVYDFDTDPSGTTLLEPCWVDHADKVWRTELTGDVDTIRYYVRATATLSYVE
jgi:hypothetical protein